MSGAGSCQFSLAGQAGLAQCVDVWPQRQTQLAAGHSAVDCISGIFPSESPTFWAQPIPQPGAQGKFSWEHFLIKWPSPSFHTWSQCRRDFLWVLVLILHITSLIQSIWRGKGRGGYVSSRCIAVPRPICSAVTRNKPSSGMSAQCDSWCLAWTGADASQSALAQG